VEIFDGAGVSFVAVTQAFNTTSSMGRLTLNVLLAFAQFEREVTAERIRDKVAASKRKGMRMGGVVPMGYHAREKALVGNVAEAEAVRTIFREYLALGSVPGLRKRLATLGIVSKRRTDRHGKMTGGGAFSIGALYHLLRNPVYAGKVKHGGALHDGLHTAIVDDATWRRVQDLLDGNGGGPIAGRRAAAARWLDGRLFDRLDRPMRTTYATRSVTTGSVRQSRRYWYYVSKPEGPEDKRPLDRLPADPLEGLVRAAMMPQLANRAWVADALAVTDAAPDDLSRALTRAEDIAAFGKQRSEAECGVSVEAFIHRISFDEGALTITLDLAPLLDRAASEPVHAPKLLVPMSLRRNGRNRPIVLETINGASRRGAELIALVADARRWMDDQVQGRARTVAEITIRSIPGLEKQRWSHTAQLTSIKKHSECASLGHELRKFRDSELYGVELSTVMLSCAREVWHANKSGQKPVAGRLAKHSRLFGGVAINWQREAEVEDAVPGSTQVSCQAHGFAPPLWPTCGMRSLRH
jgi:hypothetical protein